MSTLEAVAVTLSLLTVVLTVRQRVLAWPLGIAGAVAYGALFTTHRLYSDAALQLVFVAQGLVGWWHWAHAAPTGPEVPIRTLTPRVRALGLLALPLAALALGTLLDRHTDAAAPHLDALLAMTSLVANGLLVRKYVDSWALWIAADVGYIGLFASRGLTLSAMLYALFLVLALRGLVTWRRDRERQQAEPRAPGAPFAPPHPADAAPPPLAA